MATPSRPFGVTLVAVLAWLTGAWGIIQGIIALIAGMPTWNVFAAWVMIFIGAITIVVSLGLFKGDPSARILVVIVLAVNILVAGATAASEGISWLAAIPSFALALLGILLLFLPRANAFFRG
jgi:uncharacterized membrane protein HdeD (DUF308 family)